MKKLTAFLVILTLLISSCSKKVEETETKKVDKRPFTIETRMLGSKNPLLSVEKTARLTAASSLTLTAESLGEITSIALKEGARIKKGSQLIALRDTVNSYDIRVAQAQNGVNVQDAGIETTKINLDRAVVDSEIAYDQANRAYQTLLAKTALTYDSLVNTNQKTLDTYNETYKSTLGGIETTISNLIYESDKILGMTLSFQYLNDGWEPYLGAKIGNIMSEAKNEWNKLYEVRGLIKAKEESGGSLSPTTIQADLEIINNAYLRTQVFVDKMLEMLQNNVIGGGLSQQMQDGWMAAWNGYKAQVQGSETGFNSWKGQTLSFFTNYQNNEYATKLAVESMNREITEQELASLEKSKDMKLTYENTRIDLSDRISSARLALKQAENAKNTALKAKNATLSQLGASRESGLLSLEQARRDFSRLSIVAPFDGSITKVIASPGQRVSPGTPLIEVVSNVPEILVDLEEEIIGMLEIGNTVSVKVDTSFYTGTVIAISKAAGSNLLYATRVSVPGATKDIGKAVTISFPIKDSISEEKLSEYQVSLPLKSVKIISEQEGEIALLEKEGPRFARVILDRVTGETVKITFTNTGSTEIILSDLTNFDANRFYLEKSSSQ